MHTTYSTLKLKAVSPPQDINEEELMKEWGIGVMAANPNEKVPLAPEATSRCVQTVVSCVTQEMAREGGTSAREAFNCSWLRRTRNRGGARVCYAYVGSVCDA